MEELRESELETPECLRGGKKITMRRAILQEDGTLIIPERSKKKTGELYEDVTRNKPVKFNRPRGDNREGFYGQVVSSDVERTLEVMGIIVVKTQRSFYAVV